MSQQQLGNEFELPIAARSISNCTEDTDCPGRLICIQNATWYTKQQTFCACPSNRGVVGENCDMMSGASQLQMAIEAICFIIILGCLVLSIRDYVRLYVYTRTSITSATSQTLLLLALSFIAGLSGLAISLTEYTPQKLRSYVLLPGTSKGIKGEASWFLAVLGLLFAALFETLAFLNCSVMWIVVHLNVKKMRQDTGMGVYKNILRVLQFIYVILLCAALFRLDITFGSFIAVTFVMIIFFVYTIGASRLLHMLEEAAGHSDPSGSQTGPISNLQRTAEPTSMSQERSQIDTSVQQSNGREEVSGSINTNPLSKADVVAAKITDAKKTFSHILPKIQVPTRLRMQESDTVPTSETAPSNLNDEKERKKERYQKVIDRIRRTSVFVAFTTMWIMISGFVLLGISAGQARIDGEKGAWDRPLQWARLCVTTGMHLAGISLFLSYIHPTISDNISQAIYRSAREKSYDKYMLSKKKAEKEARTANHTNANANKPVVYKNAQEPIREEKSKDDGSNSQGAVVPMSMGGQDQPSPSFIEHKIEP